MFFDLVHVHEKERRFCLSWDKMIFGITGTGYFQILIQKNIVFWPFQEDNDSFFSQFGEGRGYCFFELKRGKGEELHVLF